jgi:multisubunit Na+/H+ antiporter MnhF subunit
VTWVWQLAIGVLMVLGLLPGLLLSSRGSRAARVVGLQLAGVTTVMILIAVSVADGQSSYLIVPLVLSALLITGTLVFTRLVRRNDGARPADRDSAS